MIKSIIIRTAYYYGEKRKATRTQSGHDGGEKEHRPPAPGRVRHPDCGGYLGSPQGPAGEYLEGDDGGGDGWASRLWEIGAVGFGRLPQWL